jgi:dTDP-4-dehydrorhamnose reductase
MRILLTGTSGQVGSALLPLLQARAAVVAPPRRELDLSRPAELTARLDDLKPDLIVNPAAYTAVDRAEDDSDLAYRVNADAPAAMANWAAGHNVPLIHFSTDYVFDGLGKQPWREDSPTGPLSVYGSSKLAGDRAVGTSGALHLIVRTSWVYAARGTNFLVTVTRLANERRELRIVADQFGAPTSAQTLADAVATIVPSDGRGFEAAFARQNGIVNVTCSGETSFYGFALAIVAGLRERGADLAVRAIIPIRTHEFPTRAQRPANSRLSLDRLRRDFGIITPNWKKALDDELDTMIGQEIGMSSG